MTDQNTVRQIDRWIDAHKKDLVDLSCRLVNIDTTVPPGLNYPKISQLLASEIKDLGVTPSVSYIPEATLRRRVSPEVGLKGPRPNTYATFKGEGEEQLVSVPLKEGDYAAEVASPRNKDASATQAYTLTIQ